MIVLPCSSNTLGALAVGGHAGRRAPFAPMLMDVGRMSWMPCDDWI